MTATVIPFSSRIRQPEQTCTCPQHRLWDLADRLREVRNACAGELLVPQADHERVIEDALVTIAAAVRTREDAIR
jgi:hypothetical protein